MVHELWPELSATIAGLDRSGHRSLAIAYTFGPMLLLLVYPALMLLYFFQSWLQLPVRAEDTIHRIAFVLMALVGTAGILAGLTHFDILRQLPQSSELGLGRWLWWWRPLVMSPLINGGLIVVTLGLLRNWTKEPLPD